MGRGIRTTTACAVATLAMSLAGSRDAAAAERERGAKWLVEVDGAACAADRTAFEREVTLACEAVGGTCHVVESARDAELRATLRCSRADERWVLELRTVEGMLVSKTDLDGAPADRMREAAMEVARDQAPERLLAADSLRDTLTDGDRATNGSGFKMPRTSLALGGTGAIGGIESTSGGVHALAGFFVGAGTHATLGMTGLMGGSGRSSARHVRTGLGLSWGAPFDGSVLGCAVEGGLDVGQTYQTAFSGVTMPEAKTRAGAYGQGTLFLQVPLRGIRPYVATTLGVIASQRVWAVASADLGVAFPLF